MSQRTTQPLAIPGRLESYGLCARIRRPLSFARVAVLAVATMATPAVLFAVDCNFNGIDDVEDIARPLDQGGSEDCNANSVPDECETGPLPLAAITSLASVGVPEQTVVADFNGDGLPGLAMGYGGGFTLHLTQPDGDGVLYERSDHTVASRSLSWAGGDLDGDGDVDLVSSDAAALVVVLNGGDGSFGETAIVPASRGVFALAVGDLDDNGTDDIVVTNRSQDVVSVALGLGGGSFSTLVDYAVGDFPTRVDLRDFDGDGQLDVLTINANSDDLSLLFGRGNGNLTEAQTITVAVDSPSHVAFGDWNGDGRQDLAAGGQISGFAAIAVMINESVSPAAPAGFRDLALIRPEGRRVAALVAGDVDNDGDVDLLSGFLTPSGNFVILNDGDGTFNGAVRLPTNPSLGAVLLRDLDSDEDLEVLLAKSTPPRTEIFWNDDTQGAQFVPIDDGLVLPLNFRPHSMDMGDLDGDGDRDLAVIDGRTQVIVYANNGDGRLTETGRVTIPDARALWSITARDLDGDSDIDLAVVDSAAGGASPRSVARVLLNNGLGRFAVWGPDLSAGDQPSYITAADLNSDGLNDLIVPAIVSSSISILFNQGDANFDSEVRLGGYRQPLSACGADFDGDGAGDLAVANNGGILAFLFNAGDGSFPVRVDYPDVRSPRFVMNLDLEGDGDQDLVTGSVRPSVVSFLENDGTGQFSIAGVMSLTDQPYSLTSGDINNDGFEDIVVSTDSGRGNVFVILNIEGTSFIMLRTLVGGTTPLFSGVADLDADGDSDVITMNHDGHSFSIFQNGLTRITGAHFRESICTVADFVELSIPASQGGAARRLGKYIAPADPLDPELLPTLFQNVGLYPLHQDFLAAEFSDRFPLASYNELVMLRATRKYFVGGLYRLRGDDGPLYGFSIAANFDADRNELPTMEEARALLATVSEVFTLRPLKYFPDTRLTRDSAQRWPDQDFVFIDDPSSRVRYQPYTQGVGYGTVRILTPEEFADASATGRFSSRDCVVLPFAPRDIEGVVGVVITGEIQGALSHVAVRTARRGTPNAYIADAVETFAPFEGELVSVEVRPGDYVVRRASLEEAEQFWTENRPQLSNPPELDGEYASLDSLEEMRVGIEDGGPSRYGGKATGLARLQRVLTGEYVQYQERGFAIPMHYYLEFLRQNETPSRLDPALDVSYEQYLQELLTWEPFQTNSELRFQELERFRNLIRNEGIVAPEFVSTLALRVEEIFADLTTMVRFRSSSNAEDSLEFSGAGLYDSTSACAADTLDATSRVGSHCDPTRGDERTIERALKKVWASNWNFRAYEEREFFGISPDVSAMGIVVNRAFLFEAANGVAFTGNPADATDRRYVISVQPGEESVVSPEPGVVPEKNLLRVQAGQVVEIVRAVSSSLVEPGGVVLTDAQLEEIGGLMAHVDRSYALDLGDVDRSQVLLDFEFKIEPNGELAVKQARPFLLTAPTLPTPRFELEIPTGTVACGVFAPGRDIRTEYELKTRVEFVSGVHDISTDAPSFSGELFTAVVVGPEQEEALPEGPGVFQFTRSIAGEVTSYFFRYDQTFVLPGGETFELSLTELEFKARGEEPLARRQRFDEEFLTRDLALRGNLVGESTALLVTYSSCSYESLPLWEIGVTAEDGTRLRLLERHEPAPSLFLTGPASLIRAELDLGGLERRVMRSYWELVYAALRHNTLVQYWLVLEPEADVPGLAWPVRVVEVITPDSGVAGGVNYLDRDLELIGSSPVTIHQRELAPEVAFLRGDVDLSGTIDTTDAIRSLEHLFDGNAAVACWKAVDASDDGWINISDPIWILLHLFAGVGPLPEPFSSCGVDPTPDEISCLSFATCE